jgi:tRNA wybutosine-synthesizing protein 3
MDFENNKKTFLAKTDKSKKGSIDKHIISLINKINSLNDYYSTSSCSGRIVLLKESESGRKNEAEWVFASHDLVEFNEITAVNLEDKNNIWFKFEPPIIHISCCDIKAAQKLLDIARPLFKLSGIISTLKNIVEIRGTERIDAPLKDVSEDYLKVLVEIANQKMKSCWKKIEMLELSLK